VSSSAGSPTLEAQNDAGVGAAAKERPTDPPSPQPGNGYQNGGIEESNSATWNDAVEETQTSPPSPRPVIPYQYDDGPKATSVFTLSLFQCANVLPMNDEEKKVYSDALMDFFRFQPSLQDASVNIAGVTVLRQKTVVEKIDVCSENRRSVTTTEGAQTVGIAQSVDATGMSLDVTTIVERDSALSSDFTDVLINHVIQENKGLLVARFRSEALPYFRSIRDVSRRFSTGDPPSPLRPVIPKTLDEGDNKSGANSLSASVIVAVAVPWILLALALVGILYLMKILRQRKKQSMHYQNQEPNGNDDDESAGDEEAPSCLVAEVTQRTDSLSLGGGDEDETKSLVNASSHSKSRRKRRKSRRASVSSSSTLASSEAKCMISNDTREENEESGKETEEEGEGLFVRTETIEKAEETDDSSVKKPAARKLRRHQSENMGKRNRLKKGSSARSKKCSNTHSMVVKTRNREEGDAMNVLMTKKIGATETSEDQEPFDARLRRKMSQDGARRHSIALGAVTNSVAKKIGATEMSEGQDSFDARLRRKMSQDGAQRHSIALSAVTDSVAKKIGATEMSEGQDSFDARLRRKMSQDGAQRHSIALGAVTDSVAKKIGATEMSEGQDSSDARLRRKMSQDSRQRRHSVAASASAVGSDDFDDRLRKKMQKRDSRRGLDGRKKKEGKRTYEGKSSNEII